MADDTVVIGLGRDALDLALEFAGLGRMDLTYGSHPDSGKRCLFLRADVRQYSAFLVALAVQQRSAGSLAHLVDLVQIEHDSNGDTRFWLPSLSIRN